MPKPLPTLVLLSAAALGGVVLWQRLNETPPTAPTPLEPFMAPSVPSAPSAPGTASDPAAGAAGVVEEAAATAAEVGEAVSADGAAPLPEGGVRTLPDPPRSALPDPPRAAPVDGGSFTTPPSGAPDDLQRITGVGPKLEALLHEQGITTLAQVAALDDDGIDALQAQLPQLPGRIRRDDWVGQAKRLLEG